MTIDLEEARTRPVVRKGKLRYVKPSPPTGRQRLLMLAAAAVVAVVLVAAFYYIYSNRDVRDTLSVRLDKTSFQPGEEVVVRVYLVNSGPRAHSYDLSTSQTFGLELSNSSGGIVVEYSPEVQQVFQRITVGPGETRKLGDFSWNQTVQGFEGDNETWTQAPSGDYTVKVFFKGSADIAAEKRITIG